MRRKLYGIWHATVLVQVDKVAVLSPLRGGGGSIPSSDDVDMFLVPPSIYHLLFNIIICSTNDAT